MPQEPQPAATAATPRVGVVDSDRRVRAALAECLQVAGLNVIGTAGDAQSALDIVAGGAEVLIVDPRLPDLAGGEALVTQIARSWPGVRVVITGWGDTGESRITRSAAAFVAKSAKPEEFVAATLAACKC